MYSFIVSSIFSRVERVFFMCGIRIFIILAFCAS